MIRILTLLPGTGRGTLRSMVEGGLPLRCASWSPPSVTAAPRHLPVPGRIEP
jgi:hypothetical protein